MTPSSPERTGRTALVLGGGGVTGIAWETGLLHGLAQHGADLTDADTVIGTSAGSVVGAQVTGPETLTELYDQQTSPPHAEIGAHVGPGTMARLAALYLRPGDPMTRRARIGAAARAAHPGPADERLRVIADRLGPIDWPAERDLRIAAVDAESGELRVFDRNGGADLLHAVASSCAVPLVWPPVRVGERLYVDGGVRSPANADLAAGAEVIVVVAPIPQARSAYHRIDRQLARAGAHRTAVVTPDPESTRAIGRNVLDPAKRVAAALAGFDQGRRLGAEMAEGWPGRDG